MDSSAIDSGAEKPQQKESSKLSEYLPLSDDCVSELESDYLDPNLASIVNTPMVKMKSTTLPEPSPPNGNSKSQQNYNNIIKTPFSDKRKPFTMMALEEDNISTLSQDDDVCSNQPRHEKNNGIIFQKYMIIIKFLIVLLIIFVSLSLVFIVMIVNYESNLMAADVGVIEAASLQQNPLREERENFQVDLENVDLKNQTLQEEINKLKAELDLLQISEANMKKILNDTLQNQEDLSQQLQISEANMKKILNDTLHNQEDLSQRLQTAEVDARRALDEANQKDEELIQKLKKREHQMSVEAKQNLHLLQGKIRKAMGVASKLLVNSSRSDTETWINIIKVVKDVLESQRIVNSSLKDKEIGFYQYGNVKDNLVFYSIANTSPNNNSRNRYAQLSLRDSKLHLHALQEISPPSYSIILPHEQVRNVLNSGSVTTFIDLSWPGHAPSRVYIKLYGSTARAEQFLWLCTGELGPSYINSQFDAVLNKGSPGEYIVGGNYEGQSSPSLIPGLTEGGEYLKPSNAGLVTGVVVDDSTNNANFGIYVQEDSAMKNAVGFGQVVGEKSMAAIKLAAKYENIAEVVVADCGVVL